MASVAASDEVVDDDWLVVFVDVFCVGAGVADVEVNVTVVGARVEVASDGVVTTTDVGGGWVVDGVVGVEVLLDVVGVDDDDEEDEMVEEVEVDGVEVMLVDDDVLGVVEGAED